MSKQTLPLGDGKFTLRPLSLRQVRDPEIAADITLGGRCGPKASDEEVAAYCRILKLGLRDHPEVTVDQLQDLIDLGDVGPVWAALMGLSGFVKGE